MPHEFDVLKQWAELNDSQLQQIVSDETIAILQRVASFLADEVSSERAVVTRANFSSIVHEMQKRYREGSWQLGEAIIKAGDLSDQKAYGEAKDVYQRFLSSCPWKFYRDIARSQLKKLQNKGPAEP